MNTYEDYYKLNFSYIIDEELAGMRKPGMYGDLDEDLNYIAQHGIKAIVSLTPDSLPKNILRDHGFDYLHLPVPDFSVPSLEQVWSFIQFVKDCKRQDKPVVVHCFAGQGRTAVFLAAYLVCSGFNAKYAIQYLKQNRPNSFDTQEQEDFILNWEKHCSKQD